MEYVEVFAPEGRRLVSLQGDRTLIGKAKGNEISVPEDGTMSRTHAVLERYATGWAIRDMGSRNGTTVNGERLWGERHLRGNDEIRVGRTRLVYRTEDADSDTRTHAAEAPPELTRRELDVLRALCRPLVSGDIFTEPASIRAIAKELVVTDAAVKQHLANLYDKFQVYGGEERRRLQLANEAIRRGAINVADLRER